MRPRSALGNRELDAMKFLNRGPDFNECPFEISSPLDWQSSGVIPSEYLAVDAVIDCNRNIKMAYHISGISRWKWKLEAIY